ncbi:hypothetical protein H310_00310 [Aphanomyces invadans]|uniref:PDZ domain-containing protein n=1 Tax=Aphanomyces invadans TaxID=157072 RepID=A0A024UVA2_9STRA|nr:hypothetical protein H310_00310 [Aphanomyces invadans]ETW09857.1 hypothetical protein H310_00310 [Aphanomyces invadans]|eukprot:XP_008861268.1 hypothetical protein H310_00310 [Aphanomyces invadans]
MAAYVSSYEEERAAKIARNKAMLISLGLEKPQPAPKSGATCNPSSTSESQERTVTSIATSPRVADPMSTFEHRRMTTKSPESPLRRSLRVEKNMKHEFDKRRMHVLYHDARIITRNHAQQQKLFRKRQMRLLGPNSRTDTTFSNNEKNKRIMKENGLDAPKRRVHEFSVTLKRGVHGYCIYLGIVKFRVSVVAFRQPTQFYTGPAEACGLIQPGDILVSINGEILFGGDDFRRKWAQHSTDSSITLGFRRLLEKV